jgi:hypothetical protein
MNSIFSLRSDDVSNEPLELRIRETCDEPSDYGNAMFRFFFG